MSARCQYCGKACSESATVCGSCGRAVISTNLQSTEPSSVFVGRQRDLDALTEKLDGVFTGRGALVMLAGEAGIGKTWMAREFARLARRRGAVVLWGCCFEGDWQPAYGPWVEALGEYVRASGTVRLRRLLGHGASTLAKLLPQIRTAIPDLADAPPLAPDDERLRLYDAVIRFLQSIAEEHPVLLVIDDLHWADRDSLRLLRYLVRSIPGSRLMVVGAYRDPETGRGDNPIAEILPILRREIDYLPITLQGLDRDQVAEYLALATGRPLPGALVQAFLEETGGNPFFVRELLRHLREEGKILVRGGRWSTDFSIGELGIPEGIRQLVHRRMARLADETSSLLRLAAGFTGGFEFPVMQALSGLPEERLLDCIDEALRAGLIRVTGHLPAMYDFAHTIVRHTLYEELNPDRGARLHRQIAMALEKVYRGRELERAGELASQYHASSTLPDASNGLQYALAAAEQARAAYAHDRAATFLRMARDLADNGPALQKAEILCRLAVAEAEVLMLQESGRSARDASAALNLAGADPRTVAEFLEKAASALKAGGAPGSVWSPLVEQGLSLLGEVRDLLWARLTLLRDRLEVVSIGTINASHWLEHDPEAVSIARESGGEEDYARTLEPLAWRSRDETERILALVRGWSHPVAIIRAMDVAARDLLKRHGDHREAAVLYQELLETSERYGFIPGQAEALMQLAFIQTAFGELDRADDSTRRAQEMILRLGPSHALRFGITALTSLRTYFLDTGWPESTSAAAKFAASPEAARNPRGLVAGAYAALGYARMGDEAASRKLLVALTPVIGQMEPTMYVHHAAIAFGGCAVWEVGAADHAAEYQRMARELVKAGFGDSILSHELTIGRMASLLGKREEAEESFSGARQRTDAMGLMSIRAIVDHDEALALIRAASTERDRILELIGSAERRFEAIGMHGWVRRAQALQQSVSPTARESGHDAERNNHNPAGLTGREIDVLRLLVSGRSNNEIARELTLSVRTVERHLANIYAKTGAHGRVDATTYAYNSGLASPPVRD